MKALTDAQKQAIAKGKLYSAYLLDITLQGAGAPTLHISDRTVTVAGVTYQNYLEDLSGLGEEIDRANSEGRNADITLVFKNKKYLTYNFLSEIGNTYPFEGALITIKEVLIDDLNVPGEPITIHVGLLDEAQDVDTLSFTYQASSLWKLKDEQFKQVLITAAVYPGADPDDINKPVNIIYGSCQQVKCHAVDAGAVDSIVADMSATIPGKSDTWEFSDASQFPSSGAFTIQIENEQIRIASRSGNTLTLASSGARGYNSTTPVVHHIGQTVFEVKTSFVYLIAEKPVKAIGSIYVDRVRQTGNYTAYTGQSGDELSGYAGKAVVVFSAKPIVQKQINAAEIIFNDPSHNHSAGSQSSAQVQLNYESRGTLANTIDGNESTFSAFWWPDTWTTFKRTSSYSNSYWPYRMRLKIRCGETYIATTPLDIKFYLAGSLVIDAVWHVPGDAVTTWYSNYFSFTAWSQISDGGTYAYIKTTAGGGSTRMWEISYAVEYYTQSPYLSYTGASLSGLSSADVVVGESVNANVDGHLDDGSGTYTGTPSALIERPDHVLKHFLDIYFGYSLSDIDTASFAAAGVLYAAAISGGYKFAFCINKEIRSAKQEILENLASQCRSTLVEEGGKWYLDYIPDTAPTADKTIKASELAGEYAKFLFNKTARVDIENDLTAKFSENYGKLSYDESEWQGTAIASDATSQGKYGIKPATYIFNAIRSQAMADHILAFKLLQKKNPLWLMDATLFWQHYDLERGDTIAIENALNNGIKFFLEWVGRPKKGFVAVKGKEWAG